MSVGQRASKLPAFKDGGLKKKSASWPRPQSASLPRFDSRLWSNHFQSLMAGNFAALWPTDPKFSALKNLNPFQTVSKVKEASNILRVVFALSKWPHLHRAYLLVSRLSCTPLYNCFCCMSIFCVNDRNKQSGKILFYVWIIQSIIPIINCAPARWVHIKSQHSKATVVPNWESTKPRLWYEMRSLWQGKFYL